MKGVQLLPKHNTMRRVAALAAGALVALAVTGSASAVLGKKRVASGFSSPIYATSAPGSGDLFVVEQPGEIIRLHNGTRSTFLDIRGRVLDGGERGLLSVAFHPRYAKNRRFFVYYTNNDGNIRVVEFRANSAGTRALKSTARTRISVAHPDQSNHNGGQLQFGLNGLLYAGTGDGGSGGDPPNNAQNLGSRLGKLLVLNVDRKGARTRIAALGLRNPWRFSVDRKTGVLWIGDVGQEAWEEVDRFQPGTKRLENYGWSRFEGHHLYNSSRQLGAGTRIWPVAEYQHVNGRCAITGGSMVRGRVAGAGRYFYGDYCSGEVWSFRWANGRKSGFRKEPFGVGGLTSFGLDRYGRLLLVSQGGTIYRLVQS